MLETVQAGPRRKPDTRTHGEIKGDLNPTNTCVPEHKVRTKDGPIEDGGETKTTQR